MNFNMQNILQNIKFNVDHAPFINCNSFKINMSM